MATLVYADAAAYEGWSGGVAPDNITALLRSASILVRNATRLDLYDVDVAGKPSDTDVAAAFSDATCEHALYWQLNEIDPAAGSSSVAGAVTGSTIDGATVTFDATAAQQSSADRAASLTGLCSNALAILRNAGLASAAV